MRKFIKFRVVTLIVVVITILIVQVLYNKNICSFNFLRTPVERVAYPFERVFSAVVSKISNTKRYFESKDKLFEENKRLSKEVDELEKYISKIIWLDDENQRLRNTLELRDSIDDCKFVGANIIAKDANGWFEIFTIDRGSKDGVYKNSFVIFDKGLVGRVYKVSEKTSCVISIIDKDSVVGARLTKTRDIAVLKGDMELKEDGCCRLEYIPEQTQINIGDVIETSGIGEYFPKGIEIGVVKDVVNPKDKLERYAIIKPSVDLKRIEEVLVSIDN